MCYVGALKALKELNVEIGSIAGSSVGAVFASLLASGYSEEEIKDIFLDFNFNVFRDINIGFSPDLSFSKGELFLNYLRDKISLKVFGEKNLPVYFKDLKKDLFILTTDLTKHTTFVFSKYTTPDVEVAFAVRVSAGMPGLMKPLSFNDSVLVDGDLSKSRAVWKTDKRLVSGDERVLEFRLEGTSDDTIKNPIDYITTVYNAFSYLCTSNVIERYGEKDKFDYIVFDTGDLLMIDFSISHAERLKLIELGYNETVRYFKENLLHKKTELVPLYKFLKDKISELKTCLHSNNYSNSYNKINEILASSFPVFEKADTVYNTKLLRLKDLIQNSRQKGMFQNNRISKRSDILAFTEYFEMEIDNKIKELQDYINLYKNYH